MGSRAQVGRNALAIIECTSKQPKHLPPDVFGPYFNHWLEYNLTPEAVGFDMISRKRYRAEFLNCRTCDDQIGAGFTNQLAKYLNTVTDNLNLRQLVSKGYTCIAATTHWLNGVMIPGNFWNMCITA